MKCPKCGYWMIEQIGRVLATIGDVRITVNRTTVFYCQHCRRYEVKTKIKARVDNG